VEPCFQVYVEQMVTRFVAISSSDRRIDGCKVLKWQRFSGTKRIDGSTGIRCLSDVQIIGDRRVDQGTDFQVRGVYSVIDAALRSRAHNRSKIVDT
jgi:hypothetical protein